MVADNQRFGYREFDPDMVIDDEPFRHIKLYTDMVSINKCVNNEHCYKLRLSVVPTDRVCRLKYAFTIPDDAREYYFHVGLNYRL